jgi:superfamily II DNA or RNA helicase
LRVLKNSGLNIIWLVSSKELAEQSLQAFKRLWKQKGDHPVKLQRYFGDFNTLEQTSVSTVTFATFGLIAARIDTPEVKCLFQESPFLFIDEAHQSEAFTYEGALRKYRDYCPNYNIIGLTATPFRGEDNEYLHFKQNFNQFIQLTDDNGNILDSPIAYLMKQGYLAEIEYIILNGSEGIVSESEHFRTLNHAVLNECKELKRCNNNTIIYAKSKSHAIALSIFLKREGFVNGLVVGETPDVIRKNYLTDFSNKDNELNILINHLILSTGIDVPGMNSIMILGDIESPSLALQILGRAMRGPKNGGNKKNTVYLTKQNYNRLCDFKLLENIVLQ